MQKMREKYVDTLAKLYEYATTVYSKNQYTQWYDTKDGGYTYGSFKNMCDTISKKLTQYGIGAGDKVAILSQSMPNWSVAFFATVSFGRISIPILPDSSENEVTNIINHSESKVIFVSKRLAAKLSQEIVDRMTLVIELDTFEVMKADDEKFTCDGRTSTPTPDDIATIIYTSGTTGSAKGVVLSHRNLTSNVITCYHSCKRGPKDRWLSILPMSHTLEMTLGMLYFIVISYDASFEWWLLVILLYGGSIFLSVGLYPRLMSKIHLDETGIRKTVFRKSKARFIKWEDVRDVQVVTRPNGYAYILVSDSKITCKSFEEVLKEKNIIYFTYKSEAVEFIDNQLSAKGLKDNVE